MISLSKALFLLDDPKQLNWASLASLKDFLSFALELTELSLCLAAFGLL